jgi:hypothetical protein
MIICAAIKLQLPDTELVVCGVRHGDCIRTMNQLDAKWVEAEHIYGFVTEVGEFLDRGQAWAYALENGQIPVTVQWFHEDNGWPAELVSEDLY